ncbi:MAG: AIR synthase-related protein [Balneolaceae bacterium]
MYTDKSLTVGSALLKPHVNYLNGIQYLLEKGVAIKSLSHITGGGLIENVKRTLPKNVDSHFYKESWPINPIFRAIEELGNVPKYEMFRTFNMGLGLTIVVAKQEAKIALELAKEAFSMPVYEVGKIVEGSGKTIIEGAK